jgi:hypothetical protein
MLALFDLESGRCEPSRRAGKLFLRGTARTGSKRTLISQLDTRQSTREKVRKTLLGPFLQVRWMSLRGCFVPVSFGWETDCTEACRQLWPPCVPLVPGKSMATINTQCTKQAGYVRRGSLQKAAVVVVPMAVSSSHSSASAKPLSLSAALPAVTPRSRKRQPHSLTLVSIASAVGGEFEPFE